MAGVDFNALRARTMGSGNDEEAVTVNTRALIDKVLARYSGEWTVLRELIQNGVDANATKIVIRFETSPSPSVPVPTSVDASSLLKHVVKHHTLYRLVVTNDGNLFEASDWSRLKRIAEGNPDETKIGAFGVGFYSVFADCEEPFVSSGNEAMAFYWKKNSLFTRRLQVPDGQGSQDTSFVLDYRSKTTPIPPLLGLCQFLATSLTFVGLQKLELWLDEWNLLTLTKKPAPSVSVVLPRDVETRTREGLMTIRSVERESVEIHAKWLNVVGWKPTSVASSSGFDGGEIGGGMSSAPSLRSFFSKLTGGVSVVNSAIEKAARFESEAQKAIAEDIAGISTATVSLRITTANVHSSVTASFAREIERATKKPPPKVTRLAILTSSHEEGAATKRASAQNGIDIFSTMLPSKSGKVFIGFPTHQTTGLLAHISAHSVIPTVERESIDLNARWVSTWNIEMLRIAGIVCRIAWSGEMNEIREMMRRAAPSSGRGARKEEVDSMMSTAVHVCRQFTFQDSTPSNQVGQLVEGAFWMCNKQATIEVFSTRGVLPSYEVRIATEDLSGFVDGIPVIPEALMKEAKGFVDKVKDLGLVTEVSIPDVKKELEAKALDGRQLGEFLRWVAKKAKGGDLDLATIKSLLGVTVASVGQHEKPDRPSQLLLLGDIKYFVNPARISPDMPIPPDTMPFTYTRGTPVNELRALGWEELGIAPWLQFLAESSGKGNLVADNDITTSPKFASQVLATISKQWDQINQPSRAKVVGLLENRTVIPTKQGMMRPAEAYFPSVKLFPDLPVVTDLHSIRDNLLLALGVRKTVELGVVFERLMSDSKAQREAESSPGVRWSHVDLICYLASVREDIPSADISRLKDASIFGAEGTVQSGADRRYKISELFTPTDPLRKLELPVLQWNGMFRPSSREGRFLSFLGLKSFPSIPELVQAISKAAAKGNMALADQALAYWIRMYHENGYGGYDCASIKTPFLPLQGEKSLKLATPADCFTNDLATLLGFEILRRDLHPNAFMLGVKPNPPMPECVSRLISKPPTTMKEAKELFGYFAMRLAEIGPQMVERLGSAKFVPIPSKVVNSNSFTKETRGVRYVSPKNCFLGDSSTYGSIFDFVDFGSEANSFLLKVGSKHEPTKSEIAYMLVREPARLLSVFQSAEKYLGLLRSLADSFESLKKDKVLYREMRRASFLLASKEIPVKSSKLFGKDQKASGSFVDNDVDDEDDMGIKEWRLASASEIIIVDDFASFNLFREELLTAPQEETLETWYIELGASLLSRLVQEEPKVGPFVDDPVESKKLLKLVLERSRLFLHNIESRSIRHNVRWLEKNLGAQAVRSISLRRTLRGHSVSHTEKRTAVVTQDPKRGWTLWITVSGYDMFQVSQGLVNLLITRPQFNLSLTLMSLLSTDLYTLRSRGYNVDRILRAKAEEQRIAELNRQRLIEEQWKQAQEQEERLKKEKEGRTRSSKEKQEQVAMPGAFEPETPEHVATQPPIQRADPERTPKGMFSSFTKRLGLGPGDMRQSTRHLQSFLNGNGESNDPQNDLPPPYSPRGANPEQQQQQKPSETVTSPHQLHQNLLSAIRASRPHNSSELFSPPQTNAVKETATYCDTKPSQDLTFIAESSRGIKIFLSNSVREKSNFFRTHSEGFETFGRLLGELGVVFTLATGCLHMYYDEEGSTIAFNANGSIFCNYRFFLQLHLPGMQQESQPADKRADALVYWWVVLCHELAHNLVPSHSSDHSFYTEQFVMTYFNKMMMKVARLSSDYQK